MMFFLRFLSCDVCFVVLSAESLFIEMDLVWILIHSFHYEVAFSKCLRHIYPGVDTSGNKG